MSGWYLGTLLFSLTPGQLSYAVQGAWQTSEEMFIEARQSASLTT